MKTITLLLFLFCCATLSSESFGQIYDPGSFNSGYASSFDRSRILFANPALLDEYPMQYFCAGTTSTYHFQEVQQYHCGLYSCWRRQSVGLSSLIVASDYSSAVTIQGQYGRQLFENFHTGIRVKMMHLNFGPYGNDNRVNADFGMLYRLSSRWQLAMLLQQIRPVQMGTQEQTGPAICAGLAFIPSTKARLIMELEQRTTSGIGFRCALEYSPRAQITVKSFLHSQPSRFGFGISYRIARNVVLESIGIYHPVLGLSTGLDVKILSHNLKKKSRMTKNT